MKTQQNKSYSYHARNFFSETEVIVDPVNPNNMK